MADAVDIRARNFDPEAEWEVVFWDRVKYITYTVHAPDSLSAFTFARHSILRDGFDPHTLSYVRTTRIN